MTASTIGSPTLPTATLRSPAARRIASSIWTVVVLPLVPVTASQGVSWFGVAQPPGQLDLAPDRYAAVAGLREQRRVGSPARRGDEQVDVVGERRRWRPRPSRIVGAEHLEQLGLLGPPVGAVGFSSRAVTAAPRCSRLSAAAKPGDPEPGDDGADAVPGVVPAQVGSGSSDARRPTRRRRCPGRRRRRGR